MLSPQDSWRPYLVFLAADHALLQPHLEALMGVADGGNRRRFIVIDREAMLLTVSSRDFVPQ